MDLSHSILRLRPTTKRRRERRRRQVTTLWMQASRDAFKETGNPIHAWEAYWLARKAGVPVPGSVYAYFDEVAARISYLARHQVPRKGDVAKAVTSAVGLQCRGRYNPFDPFDGWARAGHELSIAIDVYESHTANWMDRRERGVVGNDFKAICEAGAARHNATCDCGKQISWKTAERFFRKHARIVIPGHLQRKSKSQKLGDILR